MAGINSINHNNKKNKKYYRNHSYNRPNNYHHSFQSSNEISNRIANNAVNSIRKYGNKSFETGRKIHQPKFHFKHANRESKEVEDDPIEDSDNYRYFNDVEGDKEKSRRKETNENRNHNLITQINAIEEGNTRSASNKVLASNDWMGISPRPSPSFLKELSAHQSSQSENSIHNLPPLHRSRAISPLRRHYNQVEEISSEVEDVLLVENLKTNSMKRYDSNCAMRELENEMKRVKEEEGKTSSKQNKDFSESFQYNQDYPQEINEFEILEFSSHQDNDSLLTEIRLDELPSTNYIHSVSHDISPHLISYPKVSSSPTISSYTPRPLLSTTPKVSSPPPPTIEESYYTALASEFEPFNKLSSNFFTPKKVEWYSSCSITSTQRENLSKSWNFNECKFEAVDWEFQWEIENIYLSDRMGLGCLGIKEENFGTFDAILRGIGEESFHYDVDAVLTPSTTNTNRSSPLIESDMSHHLPPQTSSSKAPSSHNSHNNKRKRRMIDTTDYDLDMNMYELNAEEDEKKKVEKTQGVVLMKGFAVFEHEDSTGLF